jgi:hypothetical protein
MFHRTEFYESRNIKKGTFSKIFSTGYIRVGRKNEKLWEIFLSSLLKSMDFSASTLSELAFKK